MASKITLWTLKEEYGESEWFRKIDASRANTYRALRLRLVETKCKSGPLSFGMWMTRGG